LYNCALASKTDEAAFATVHVLCSPNVRFERQLPKGAAHETSRPDPYRIRHVARAKHFSYRTEQCYVYWAERYIRFHGIRHPNTMGAAEAEAFLNHLAVTGHVAASTQNQALAALLFLWMGSSWGNRRCRWLCGRVKLPRVNWRQWVTASR